MADQFRDCFVGDKGYEALKKVMKIGSDISLEYARCFQERYDAELAYVKALRKTSDSLHKLSGRSKGSILQALDTIGTLTEKESDAHMVIANALLQQISIPLKNLTETQAKDRRTIEETLNGKLKSWRDKKDVDNKYRTRHFERSKEIEALYMRASESAKTGKSGGKDTAKGTVSTPLVLSCVLPNGRHSSASEKPNANSDAKYQANLDSAIQKAEDDLEKIDRKYHDSTKDVELNRQIWDAELCRACDQMEKIETDRMTETEKSIQNYAKSMQGLSDTMYQIVQELYSIRVSPGDDIISEAKSNIQTTEIEILVYDIYAENDHNTMTETRRISSLMRWMEFMNKDINNQRIRKDTKLSSPSSASSLAKSHREDSSDDRHSSSSDGAMCSTSSPHLPPDPVLTSDRQRDASSSSSNDDDGAMRHHRKEKKCEKKNKEANDTTGRLKAPSNDPYVNRQSTRLFLCLYEASLHKFEKVYNHLKHLQTSDYEYSNLFAKSFNDKGFPTTVLRVPFQPMMNTPPSAPSTTRMFAQAMPMFNAPQMNYAPQVMQMRAPPMAEVQFERIVPAFRAAPEHVFPEKKRYCSHSSYNQVLTSAPAYPNLDAMKPRSAQPSPVQQQPEPSNHRLVRATHPYVARRRDELTINRGDIIVLLKRRQDDWCEGNLNNQVGLFPGTFVEDV